MISLINNGLQTSGITRAYVIKRDDIRIYIPGMMNENIMPGGVLDESIYSMIKDTLPIPLFNSKALESLLDNNPTPCWVVFEIGDNNRPMVMGYLGKGVKSVGSYGGGSGSAGSGGGASGGGMEYIGDASSCKVYLSPSSQFGNDYAYGNTNEAVQCQKIADAAGSLFAAQGISVKVGSNQMSNSEKVSDSNSFGATVHIPIHTNAAGGKGAVVLCKGGYENNAFVTGVYNQLRTLVPGNSNRIWVRNDLKEINQSNAVVVYCECEFHDYAAGAKFIIENTDKIAAAIVNGITGNLQMSSSGSGGGASGGSGKGSVNASTPIMGNCVATANQMRAYLRQYNPSAPDYVDIYISEGAIEGVRGDIAFAQSCIETGYWKFGGDVTPDQNNFAGIGTTGGGVKGNYFNSPQIGIRAQIQHLKAYASTAPLNGTCVDPRFSYVTRGSAKTLGDLGNGKWAKDSSYSSSIINAMNEILSK